MGTIWNSWETRSGVVATRTDRFRENQFEVTRTIQTTRTDLWRTNTSDVVEQIDEESQGTRVISWWHFG